MVNGSNTVIDSPYRTTFYERRGAHARNAWVGPFRPSTSECYPERLVGVLYFGLSTQRIMFSSRLSPSPELEELVDSRRPFHSTGRYRGMRWHRTRFPDGSRRYFARRGDVVFIVWRVSRRGDRAWKCLCSAFDEEWFGPSLRAATLWAGEKMREVPDPIEDRLEREKAAGLDVR
ncbi:MAG: hypothetical protein GY854_26505 [Deltaproteobacteria bacterium]|nr:hypothetical protein [Deltaproteobacteria bacterium]